MNGVNGGGQFQAGMAAQIGPTPAGHQAELNYIYGMVEDLSRQLAENRRVTEEIVSGLGRVRSRARQQGLGNDDLIGEASDEINAQEGNLDTLISILTESLDRAKLSRDQNAQLLHSYARTLSILLSQFHQYKQKHIADVTAWHKSYRAQLAEARSENSKLREQIWEMQEHAGSANKLLREFRKRYDEDEDRMDRWKREKALRQEVRFWKRMALPELDDSGKDEEGNSVWSDDDDLIDPIEKERKEVERKVAEQQLAGMSGERDEESEGEDRVPMSFMGVGGVAMERDREGSSAGLGMPTPPPRPASTGSTGSSGQ